MNLLKIKEFCEENKLSLFVVFGSYANLKTHKKSDIDIAVLPENYNSEVDKLKLIYELERIFDLPVDLVVVTNHIDSLLEFEIFSNGKSLYEERDGLFEERRLKAWKKYLDTERIRELRGEFINNYIKELKDVARSNKA